MTTLISKTIKDNLFNVTTDFKNFKEIEVSLIDFKESMEDIKQRLKIKLRTGYCSEVLIQQLARHNIQIGEKFGNEIHFYHLPNILEIIECLENGCRHNMKETKFLKSPLKDLWHIHHNPNNFVKMNMANYWKTLYPRNGEINYQNKRLEQIYNNLIRNEVSEKDAQKSAQSFLLGSILYESKLKKSQTGEWIVYVKNENANYYLCLATHKEAKDFSDQIIFDRITCCFKEFPQLKYLLTL